MGFRNLSIIRFFEFAVRFLLKVKKNTLTLEEYNMMSFFFFCSAISF